LQHLGLLFFSWPAVYAGGVPEYNPIAVELVAQLDGRAA
jgi:hypothetical protein